MKTLNAILWGTYDTGKPRVRLMRAALQPVLAVPEIHADVWTAIEDKSQLSRRQCLKQAWHMLRAYPGLIRRYRQAPAHEAVIVGYMGLLDVLVLWPFARQRKARIVWDMFFSLYDTVVHDRQMLSARHPLAWLLYAAEWLACRAADTVVLDTKTHARYVARLFHLPEQKMRSVHLGAEEAFFPPAPPPTSDSGGPLRVLFYGQCIPLHGLETIIRAAQACTLPDVHWLLIGRGQEAPKMEAMLKEHPVENLHWLPWVAYEDLHRHIHQADVCLGIFGGSAKAEAVLPNKLYQVLACGKPIITRESPALRELDPGVAGQVVRSARPNAIAHAPDITKAWQELLLRQP